MRLFKALPAIAAVAAGFSMPAHAAGDLLVAPTRVVMNGARGTEVILNNIGDDAATYRISLQLLRMKADGSVDEIEPDAATPQEALALSMISYAPRRVVLAPNQPQSIRIGVRPPEGLADGEYRAHMLFRAIPDAKAATAGSEAKEGVSISLTPIYGITIPIIVRQGALAATASIKSAQIVKSDVNPLLVLDMERSGTRSTYGRIRVTKAGVAKPVFEARGLAIYADVPKRQIKLPLDPVAFAALNGPVKIEYLEDVDAGGALIAELSTVIR